MKRLLSYKPVFSGKFMSMIFSLSVILSMLMTGCAAVQLPAPADTSVLEGQTLSMGARATAYAICQAIDGKVGYTLYVKDGFAMVAWAVKDRGIALYLFDIRNSKFIVDVGTTLMGSGGTVVSWKEGADFVKWATENGWTKMNGGEFVNKVMTAMADTAISTSSKTLTTFVLIPADIEFTVEDLMEIIAPGYSGVDG